MGFVTGHAFGRAAMRGILASPAYGEGLIELCFSVGLDATRADATVGYATTDDLVEGLCPHVVTRDGRLDSLAEQLAEASPDVLFVVGWSALVSDAVLGIPLGITGRVSGAPQTIRGIGMHPTNLPLGRGQAPIPWTIIKGLESTALSVFLLQAAADAGPILAQYDVAVDPQETAASLFERFASLHFKAGHEMASKIASGDLVGTVQDERDAEVWPRRRPLDGLLDSTMSRCEVDAQVRALVSPYPGARTVVDGIEYRVEATSFFGAAVNPDEHHRAIAFQCSDGELDLLLAVD